MASTGGNERNHWRRKTEPLPDNLKATELTANEPAKLDTVRANAEEYAG